MDANAHIGKIGFFNGKFGFIHREEEKIFFHKRSINVFYKPHRNDLVRFFIAKDAKKNDRQIAVKIIPIINEIICNRLEKQGELHIGKVDWYRDTYGVIEHIGNKIFFHNSNVIFSDHYIHGDEVCVFNVIKSKKRIDTYEAVNVIFLKNALFNEYFAEKIISIINELATKKGTYGNTNSDLIVSILEIINENDYCKVQVPFFDASSDVNSALWIKGLNVPTSDKCIEIFFKDTTTNNEKVSLLRHFQLV